MPNYLLRDIPEDLWRQVKSKAAMEGITIREMILNALRERTNTHLTGWEAVGFARARGLMLSKLADPTEGERIDDISPDEAEEMLRNDLPPEDLYIS